MVDQVRLENVTKRYGDEVAVDSVSITVQSGETLGIVGPSGCGKTTTLRTIAGFETPTEGSVFFGDEDVTHVPPERRNVGLVFQGYALFDNMTVQQNVEFGLKMQGLDADVRAERAGEVLELLDIAELADRDPTTLSGGQQQRVGFARALAIEPRILLLDEPMTGLDAQLKDRLQREIGSLLDDLGVTALYVTHDQEEAMVMCDRIAVMSDGVIEQIGSPRAIYEEPENEFVAGFVGNANVLNATATNGSLDFGFHQVDKPSVTKSGEVKAIVRPGDITIGEGPIDATVTELYYVGQEIRATVRLPDGQDLSVQLDNSMGNTATGDTVALDIDSSGIHVIRSEKIQD